MTRRQLGRIIRGIRVTALFLVAALYAFPIFYMIYSSFKPERDVAPPSWDFNPTLENYETVFNDALVRHTMNSVYVTTGTVALTILLGVPIAYTIVYGRLRKPIAHYNWYITTTLLPAVAVIMPIYLVLNWLDVLDSRVSLIILYTAMGIPLMVWMGTNYMLDIPRSITEAAEMDGCSRWQAFFHVILPIVRGGIIATALLVFITTWNEFLFALSFTFTDASTLPVYMNRYMTQQGLFWGKMSAVATIAIAVPILFGFVAQRSLVKGMLSGAVKE